METGDRKLNEVKKVTDMAYVPVIMADGSIGQIAKSDLASVVAEHLPYIKPNGTKESGDFNDFTSIGIYFLAGAKQNFANAPQAYSIEGFLIVFKGLSFIAQIFVYAVEPSVYVRTSYGSSWKTWVKM